MLAASRKTEFLLRTMIDSTPDLIFIVDKNHRYQMVNRAFAARSTHTPEYYRNKTALEIGIDEEVVFGNPAKNLRGIWEEDNDVVSTGLPKRVPSR